MFPEADQVYYEKDYNFPQRKMREILDELNVPMLDTLPLLRKEYRQGNTDLFYDWCHHTPKGNDFIAQWVVDFLEGLP